MDGPHIFPILFHKSKENSATLKQTRLLDFLSSYSEFFRQTSVTIFYLDAWGEKNTLKTFGESG